LKGYERKLISDITPPLVWREKHKTNQNNQSQGPNPGHFKYKAEVLLTQP